MLFSKLSLAIAAFALGTNAAIVDLYSDRNCQVPAGSRNVWDNSCAPLGGYQSFKLTYPGGNDQVIRAYSRNACAGPETQCLRAFLASGVCYGSWNNDGGSNAMGSSAFKC
jgi:hypothetical protein